MGGDIGRLFDTNDSLELAAMVKKGDVTASELTEAAIDRIEALDPTLNAVCIKTFDYARKAAADPNLPDGPFKGVPFLLKDLATFWEGIPATSTCPYFKDVISPGDMEICRRMKQAGFVLVGRSNSPEFGWALNAENTMFGYTKNPWNLERTPGGSSGGAAAALASRMVPFADASDGAGSIRVPASHCGLVGLKPSRGRVTLAPFYADYWHGGAIFFALTHTVRETAAYLDTIAGRVVGDPYYTFAPDTPFLDEVGKDPGKLRIAFTTRSPDGKPIHPEVAQGVKDAAKLCESLGHHVEEKDMTLDWDVFWRHYTNMTAVQTAAAFQASAPFVGHEVQEGEIAPTLWDIAQHGKAISGVKHAGDIDALRMIARAMVQEMSAYDVHLMPVMGQPPRPHHYYDMQIPDSGKYNFEIMGPDCTFTAPFNNNGLPAISVPLHMTSDGLPIGVQIVGQECGEALLLRLASQFEQAKPWKDRRPPITA